MSSFRERNDRRPHREGEENQRLHKGLRRAGPPPRGRREDHEGWIWGRHAVEAALTNPARTGTMRLVATPAGAKDLEAILARGRKDLRIEPLEPQELGRLLPQGASHQGVALRTPPLEGVTLEELAEPGRGVMIMLDQVTDPQNVGAVFRSAAAFGARGVILQDRNAPQLSGSVAKAAAGAIEKVPCARVVNLSRALEQLADLGWRAVGLDGGGEQTLEHVLDARPTVLVLGSEGEGLRRLVLEHCDALARIAMPGGFESLNVSNAAAIALYEALRSTRNA